MACHNSDCKTVHAFLYFAVIYPVTLHVASAVNRIFSYVNRVIFLFQVYDFRLTKDTGVVSSVSETSQQSSRRVPSTELTQSTTGTGAQLFYMR